MLIELLGTLIFFFCSLPILYVRPTKIKWIFSVKSVVLPPVIIGLFIFCMLQGKGNDSKAGSFAGHKTLHGTNLAWAMLSAINSCMGKTASLIVNQVK